MFCSWNSRQFVFIVTPMSFSYRTYTRQYTTPLLYDFKVGKAHYLWRIGSLSMSLAVLLTCDCHRDTDGVRSLTKQSVIFERAPHKCVHLILSRTKTEASQSLIFGSITVKMELLRRWWVLETEDHNQFPFSSNHIDRRLHRNMRK